MRMQTSDKTGGIIFFGLNESPELRMMYRKIM